jgi:hypothetical protein
VNVIVAVAGAPTAFAAKAATSTIPSIFDQGVDWLSENMPRTLHSAFVTGRAIVTFRTDPGPRLVWGGAELQPGNIIRHDEGENAFQHSSGPAHWGAAADEDGHYCFAVAL